MDDFDPEVTTVLRMGVYQIQFLEKIPQSAVVNEAVELTKAARKRSASGLVNAVLRKCKPPSRRPATSGAMEIDTQLREAVRRSFPQWLRDRWAKNFGPDAADALGLAGNLIPPTTLRVCAGTREEVQRRLADEAVETELGCFAPSALVVRSGKVLSSQAFKRGDAIIQDEASQLVAGLAAPAAGQRVLDLCAAPGIKTSQLAAALGAGTLIACDLSARRLRTMERLLRDRVPPDVRLHIMRVDAAEELPLGYRCDRILRDVPCSGTGTLARNPEIKWRLQAGDLERLAAVQARMLRNALKALAPGGRLVYSTCSLEPEENEQVVEGVLREVDRFRMLSAEELSSAFPELKPLFDACGHFRTRPDLHHMDGFFAVVITTV